jgi:hypothetical protein
MVYTKPAKVDDAAGDAESAWVELGGVIKKNKTFPPKLEYNATLALKHITSSGVRVANKGDLDNADKLVSLGKKHGLVKKVGDGVGFDITILKTEKALVSHLNNKPELMRKLWSMLVKEVTGTEGV